MPETQTENALAAAILVMPASAPKDGLNKHSAYRYATADSIYATARSHLAEQGLTVYQQEVKFEFFDGPESKDGKTSRWIKAEYVLGFQHSLISIPEVLENVTVFAQLVNAQTAAAVRTFALKYWLRGKLLLATGDLGEDLDDSDTPAVPPKAESKSKGASEKQKGKTAKGKSEEPEKGKWAVAPKEKMIIMTVEFSSDLEKARSLWKFVSNLVRPDQKRTEQQKADLREVIDNSNDMIGEVLDGVGHEDSYKLLCDRIGASNIYEDIYDDDATPDDAIE